ncbi:MAG: HAD-IC family P-type ATPase [Candidatus Kerfeldbacteria bacterium]|nr:HAD-IC family P-type ATPase [Candidatus Kerfeldbacteria bacterium]
MKTAVIAPVRNVDWHALSVDAVLSELGTSLEGLSSTAAEERARSQGTNYIPPRPPKPSILIFLAQFQSPLIAILLLASGVAFGFKEVTDGWIILAVVLFNGVVGFIQEGRASKAMAKLATLTPQIVVAMRDGEEHQLPAEDLVVGDVVLLEAGTAVPADGRFVEAVNVKVVEAAFTGESVATQKSVDALPAETPVTERHNLGWRATTVATGRAKLVITAVGLQTRFGTIVEEVANLSDQKTPFQMNVAAFAKRLAFVIVGLSTAVFLLSILRGFSLENSILLGLSLVVSLIPEGLPVVITLTFAWGMWRMAKRHALIRKLVAVETLGSVTVIATDKTGTLTFGEMMVEEVVLDGQVIRVTGEGYRNTGDLIGPHGQVSLAGDEVLRRLIEIGVLNNDARLSRSPDGQEQWLGDPTEISLIVFGEKAGVKHAELDRAFPRVGEFPFDFALKYMVTFHTVARGDGHLIAVKGAPRQSLDMCSRKLTSAGVGPMTDADRQAVRHAFEGMAERSLRGLCIAYAETKDDWRTIQREHLPERLIYVGLVGIRDTVRPEAHQTIELAQEAGIRVMMLTGDYRKTAETVARELGILGDQTTVELIDGKDLDAMDDAELSRRLKTVRVFSRVTPEQKLRIARLLKASGEVVAMTGDGVNDVPALTEATIGVAVGMSSSDAAKETAEMVITDGNLTSIVAAVEEGRSIFRNIQRTLLFVLASNISQLILIIATMTLGLTLPLLPLHIIWLNVITDPFLGIALALEPKGPHIMRERPRSPHAPILTTGHWLRILLDGSAIAYGTLGVLLYETATGRPTPEIFAMTLTTVALGEWFTAWTSRSARRSVFDGLLTNRLMLGALVLALAMQVTIVYVPSFAKAFHIAALTLNDWLLSLGGALVVVVVEEVRKAFVRHRSRVQ